ncbi:MAG: ATP synthase F1 subunit delta [Blastocatellia bacterium]|nr:ATP synthase F1 subunit delta [Blastocatellia bacterium]
MSVTALANRYARALADVAFPKGELPEILEELSVFQGMAESNADLHEVIVNPTIPQNQKEKLLTALIARMKPRQITANFLNLLLRNQRLPHLAEVNMAIRRELDQRLGVVAAEVTTAQALTPAQQAAMQTRLKAVTGKEVRISFKTNPDLVGGVVTRIGSRVFDGSIRNQLETFRAQISQ